jgi:23S rRNA (pseudouridine1915-N3)-methyltransferase
MQKIILIAVGKIKEPWAKDAADFYVDRIEQSASFELVELPASKETDPAKQRDDESQRLLKAAEKFDGDLWALDELGKQMASISFSQELGRLRDNGQTIIFLLGGAYGLNDDVRKKARKTFALSLMTFPHELCRVVFLEQVYRAMQILKGSGYHH